MLEQSYPYLQDVLALSPISYRVFANTLRGWRPQGYLQDPVIARCSFMVMRLGPSLSKSRTNALFQEPVFPLNAVWA